MATEEGRGGCLEYLGGEMWGRTANGGGGNLPMKKVKI